MTGHIHLGIDTGGTYTDAALLDLEHRRILAKAKSVTTKGNLAVGVSKAMASALEAAGASLVGRAVDVVTLSTTLATNAVVEGHGAAIAVVLIGFDDAMVKRTSIEQSLRDATVLRVAGGHDHNGEAREALDTEALKNAIARADSGVSAYAVASSFAVRNAGHEYAARAIIEQMTGKPVTISSELSTELDAPRRALTAALNARLIPKISELIVAVREAMKFHGVDCPLMIVRGDGSVANADAVALRPIETVLSGPAASVIGAKWLCGRDNFIMSDIGGTTTDVAIVENGAPRVAPKGAEVGGWRTMVRAIDVKTVGLGGDSEVQVAMNGMISTSTQRAVPVSLLGSLYPEIRQVLAAELTETTGGSQLGRFICRPFGAAGDANRYAVSAKEREILDLVGDMPVPLRKVAGSSAAQKAVTSLRKKGLIQVSAFTPSDAAHVLGLQDNWDSECAKLAAKLACRARDMKEPTDERTEALCRDVFDAVATKSSMVILSAVLPEGLGSGALVDRVAEGRHVAGLAEIAIRPRAPIVAVGGPAPVYYPEVGLRLGCEVLLTEHAAVANSIGAAAGTVAHRATVAVEGDGSGLFKVFDGRTAQTFLKATEALDFAEAQARLIAETIARSFGARDITLELSVEKNFLPDAVNDDGLLTARVTALATTVQS